MKLTKKLPDSATISTPLSAKVVPDHLLPPLRGFLGRAARFMSEAVAFSLDHVKGQTGRTPACQAKGCNACCYDIATVTASEVLLITDAYEALSDGYKEIVRQQNKKWMDVHRRELPDVELVATNQEHHESWGSQPFEGVVDVSWKNKTPCSFLHPVSGACMIYDARPAACRGHVSIDLKGPKACEDFLDDVGVYERLNVEGIVIHFMKLILEADLPIYPLGDLNAMFEAYLNMEGSDVQLD